MLQAVLLRCKPRARFHFGKVAPDNNTSLNATSDWLHSDTLFSAIVNTLAAMHPQSEVNRLVEHFERGDIVLSSGFYCFLIGKKPVWFLPKPAHLGLQVQGEFKDFNRVRLISRGVWESGLGFDDWGKNGFLFLQNGYAVATKEELAGLDSMTAKQRVRFFKEDDAPRVKVHGADQQDAFFYLTYISIADNSKWLSDSSTHFYFLLETNKGFEQTADFQKIQTAINMLPMQGVGGERTAGCGQLQGIETHNFELLPEQGNGYCSLSLVAPAEGELGKFDRYQVLTRGGRDIGGGNPRIGFVRMLAEGAFSKSKPSGDIPTLGIADGIPYRRYGKPFWMPVAA